MNGSEQPSAAEEEYDEFEDRCNDAWGMSRAERDAAANLTLGCFAILAAPTLIYVLFYMVMWITDAPSWAK